MGTNSSKFDKNEHYDAMSANQLKDLIAFWTESVKKYPQHKIAIEELGLLQMKLAERIGRKKSGE